MLCWHISPLWLRQLPKFSDDKDHKHILVVHIAGCKNVFQLTISLSLTTINSIYLVSAWTEGLRTNLLDRLSPPDTRCSLIWSGLSSSLSPPLLSHSLSSVQSGHTEKQSCRRFFLVSVKCKHYFLNLSQTLRFPNQKSCKRNCRFKMTLHSIITLVLTDFSIITCVKIF